MLKVDNDKRSLVVEILSASFRNNPSVNYIVKQDFRTDDRIRSLMNYSFDVCHRFGNIWISEDEKACALVLCPDTKRTSLNTLLWDLKLAYSAIGLERISTALGRESRIKSFYPTNQMVYLWFIGVSPEVQGQGIGTKLLREVIDHAAQLDRPVYLETSVQRNLPWYRSFGFETYNTIDFSYTLHMLRYVHS